MADVRYTTTDPFMAYPTGRLVRLSGEPPEAAVLDDKGKWRPEPNLNKFGTDDTRPILTVEEAQHLAEHLGHPLALTHVVDLRVDGASLDPYATTETPVDESHDGAADESEPDAQAADEDAE